MLRLLVINRLLEPGEAFIPDSVDTAGYAAGFSVYSRLYGKLKDEFAGL